MTARHLAFIAFFVSFGCGPKVQPPLAPRVPVAPAELSSVLERLDGEAKGVRRYQGFLRIRGKGPEGGFDGRLVVIFERPASLRVELLGAFGSTRWSAVATGDGITVVFPGRREFVEESDSADIVGRLLGIRLSPEEVMALLSGVGTPVEAGAREGFRQAEATVLMLSTGERLELDEQGQVRRVQTSAYRASYPTDWKRDRRQIPDRFRIETDQLTANLTADDVDVNVELDPEAFDVEIPEGSVRLRPSDVDGEAVFVVTKEP